MSVMALDWGEKRVGVAVSDASLSVALPVSILPPHEILNNDLSFRRLLEDHVVERIVVGLPISLDGREHAQAARIRGYVKQLESLYGLPIEYMDERLTSMEAKRILRQMGYNEKEMRGRTDKIAAGLLLQAWLDARAAL